MFLFVLRKKSYKLRLAEKLPLRCLSLLRDEEDSPCTPFFSLGLLPFLLLTPWLESHSPVLKE